MKKYCFLCFVLLFVFGSVNAKPNIEKMERFKIDHEYVMSELKNSFGRNYEILNSGCDIIKVRDERVFPAHMQGEYDALAEDVFGGKVMPSCAASPGGYMWGLYYMHNLELPHSPAAGMNKDECNTFLKWVSKKAERVVVIEPHNKNYEIPVSDYGNLDTGRARLFCSRINKGLILGIKKEHRY